MILFFGVAIMVIVTSCKNKSSESNKVADMKHDEMSMSDMKKGTMVMDSTIHHDHSHADSGNNK